MAKVPDNTSPDPDAQRTILASYVDRPRGMGVTEVWQLPAGAEFATSRQRPPRYASGGHEATKRSERL